MFICRISFGVCGRFTGAELLSFSLAVFIVCIWVLTGHWLLMDGKLLINYMYIVDFFLKIKFVAVNLNKSHCLSGWKAYYPSSASCRTKIEMCSQTLIIVPLGIMVK